ncbi:MAG: beta-lactamase family protein, partial [Verrucomicrobia bacterium]|nr:beta-lactamase family protein [Prolixibacteraceae bacterium]
MAWSSSKKCSIILFLLIGLLNKNPTAQELQRASPASLGLSAKRLSRIDTVMNEYVANEKMQGMLMLVARHGRLAYFKAFGKMDIDANKPMQTDALFRIASMTKAITSVALMTLYEQGKFLLTDPVSKYIPEFKNPKVIIKSLHSDSVMLFPAKSEIT